MDNIARPRTQDRMAGYLLNERLAARDDSSLVWNAAVCQSRNGLLRHCKLVKLPREMKDRTELQSEGSALDAALAELERDHAVKEISGWETGFANLSRALDGIRPGLYLLIGAPAIGKTSFARQVLDQVVLQNHVLLGKKLKSLS